MNDEPNEPTIGFQIRQKYLAARNARLKKITPRPPRVRVLPANEDFRQVIKHPSGIRFPEQGSVEWPLDKFTKKRIAEGDVTVEDDGGRSRQT
jgi:hypothetical protein